MTTLFIFPLKSPLFQSVFPFLCPFPFFLIWFFVCSLPLLLFLFFFCNIIIFIFFPFSVAFGIFLQHSIYLLSLYNIGRKETIPSRGKHMTKIYGGWLKGCTGLFNSLQLWIGNLKNSLWDCLFLFIFFSSLLYLTSATFLTLVPWNALPSSPSIELLYPSWYYCYTLISQLLSVSPFPLSVFFLSAPSFKGSHFKCSGLSSLI